MKRFFGRALGAVTLFVLLFVVYAHVVSTRDARQALAVPRVVRFDDPRSLGSLESHATGGLAVALVGDHLHLGGRADGTMIPVVDLDGPPYRLIELRQHVRFRFVAGAGSILTTGLRSEADSAHAIWLEITREANGCTVGIAGDAHALGPSPVGTSVLARAPWACDDAWHDAEIRFAPDIGRALASVDGTVVVTAGTWWDERTLVRSSVGGRVAADDATLGIDVASFAVEPVPVDLSATDVDDHFDGTIVDPFWRVDRGDGSLFDLDLSTGAKGLALVAKAKTASPHAQALALFGPTNELGSMTITYDLDVSALTKGAVSIGFQNEPGPAWRFVDVGVLSLGDGKLVPFTAGHFDENGQSRFRAYPESATSPGRTAIVLDYDAKTRRLAASLDGAGFANEHVDLPPRALARIRFGVNLDEGGNAAISVRRVRVDHWRN